MSLPILPSASHICMMNIALFGATGRSGRAIISAAQAAGHSVVAHVREGSELKASGASVTIVQGSLNDPATLDHMLAGCDCAISAMGTTDRKANTILSDATCHVIAGLERAGINRLVCITSMGCGDSKAQVRSMIMRLVIRTVAKEIWADKDRQEQAIAASALDYLLVRPGGLTDKPASGDFLVLTPEQRPGKGQMLSRHDVAQFCLAEAVAPTRHREAVTLLPA